MGMEALEAAIANYRGKKIIPQHTDDEGVIVCKCFGVTDKKIERTVRENHLSAVDEVTHYTKAGGACGACHWRIEEIIQDVLRSRTTLPATHPKKAMTIVQKIQSIEETLDREVRPQLRKDGGDLELVDVEGSTVKVRLLGMCSGCQVANFTLRDLVGDKLKEFVDPEINVVEVKE
jgi:NifU-like protein